MDIVTPRFGVDVSKYDLELGSLGGRTQRFSNDEDGIAHLVGALPAGALVAMESSGGHERALRKALLSAGFAVQVHNPRRVRRLAEGLGVAAKTDALDAKVLARTAGIGCPSPLRNPEQEDLCSVSRAIADLVCMRSNLLKKLSNRWLDPSARRAYEELAAQLQAQADRLEAEFAGRVRSSRLAQRYNVARTIFGVGPMLARTLCCELPEELAGFTNRQLAAYAGLAPLDDASGKRTGPSRIGRNANRHIKAALYMPALSLTRLAPWARDLYARLKAKGRTHQQAIVAVMRKLLVLCAAVMRRGTAWQPAPPMRT
jgi:transposase